ncbi:hypothetical protein [Pseudolabrys sp.]|uniref:hypothetical protein n=1 Tax=Pseudolabrys sp. TaxID=1960880 RepID=UPI003D13800F
MSTEYERVIKQLEDDRNNYIKDGIAIIRHEWTPATRKFARNHAYISEPTRRKILRATAKEMGRSFVTYDEWYSCWTYQNNMHEYRSAVVTFPRIKKLEPLLAQLLLLKGQDNQNNWMRSGGQRIIWFRASGSYIPVFREVVESLRGTPALLEMIEKKNRK